MKERRSKLQIYSDILNAINNESQNDDVKITRIQLSSKMSFDKIKQYIIDLEKYGLIESQSGLKITDKGRLFMKNTELIQYNFESLSKTYLSDEYDPEIIVDNKQNTKTYTQNDQPLVSISQAIKDNIQIQNAMKAIIIELENK